MIPKRIQKDGNEEFWVWKIGNIPTNSSTRFRSRQQDDDVSKVITFRVTKKFDSQTWKTNVNPGNYRTVLIN
jgi:hypothetical protein